jgi:putative heme-binding domain-containing protein
VAAVAALGETAGSDVARFLLARWREMTPAVRNRAGAALVRDPDRSRLFLAALKDGSVQPWTVSRANRGPLIWTENPDIRRTALSIFEERAKVPDEAMRAYEAALAGPADIGRGEQLFGNLCAKCHKLNGVGESVGPDLGSVQHRPPSALLLDILSPSASIVPGYEIYVVERMSGGIEDGVLAAESPTAVMLRREGGKELLVPRADISQMWSAELSGMPADFDKQIDPQQMADLLTYLTTVR